MTERPPPTLLWLTQPLEEHRSDENEIAIAIPYRGLTPHRWSLSEPSPGVAVISSKRCPPQKGGVGAGGYELLRLRIEGGGAKALGFALRTPWEQDAAETRKVVIVRSD